MKVYQDIKEKVTSPGENVLGSIRLASEDGKFLEGFVYSDEARIIPRDSHVYGREVTLRYGVDVHGLADGDVVSGNIIASMRSGEMEFPVTVKVRDMTYPESFNRVGSLAEFAELAKRDAEEAFRMFRNRSFMEKLCEGNAKAQTLMKGLCLPPYSVEAEEEFLVLLGLKKRVEVSVVKKELTFEHLKETVEEDVVLRRSGWGALSLRVSTASPFIVLPKEEITDEDFVGSVADLPFRINADLLGTTRRTGIIHIEGAGTDLAVKVKASTELLPAANTAIRMEKKKLAFLRAALDAKIGAMDCAALKRKCTALVMEMREPYISSLENALARAYLADATGDRDGFAAAVLDLLKEVHVSSRADEELLRRYYIYKYSPSEEKWKSLLTDILTGMHEDPGSPIYLLLDLKVDEDARKLPLSILSTMRRAASAGACSPFLYAEALKIYEEDISLLTRFDSFTRQVLIFAVRKHLLTEEIAMRAAFLADGEKMYSPLVFMILAGAYEAYPIDAILEAICRLIIKGPARDPKCFPWYARAVDRDFRITRLYEYYLETMPESYQKVLPLSVRLYFLREASLSDAHRAFLYANIVRNRTEDPETFSKYEEAMRDFAAKSLLEGRVSADYAALYQEFADLKDVRQAEAFADIAFTGQIFCDNPRICRVVVVTREIRGEESVQLVHGMALVHSYSENTEILFEDARGHRFRSGVAYSKAPLIERRRFMDRLSGRHLAHPGIVIAELAASPSVTEESLSEWSEVAESDLYADDFKKEAKIALLRYAAEKRNDLAIDAFVLGLDDAEYAEAEKGLLLHVLLTRRLYERAFALVSGYGTEHMRTEDLIHLASIWIEETRGEEDEELLVIAECVMRRGKYDERILRYLVAWYNSSLSLMTEVRTKAEAFYVETYAIDERILARCIFSGTTVKDGSLILRHYSEKGGNPKILVPYVKLASTDAFDQNVPVDDYLGQVLGQLYDEERTASVMNLALLQYYTKKKNLSVRDEIRVDELLDMCARKNLYFAFFKDLPQSFLTSRMLIDKTVVEFREDPDAEVTLCYTFGDGEYKSQPLPRVYRGVFQKVFTLFYGEELSFYAKVKKDGQEYTTKEMKLFGVCPDFSGKSRYERINQMLRLVREGREEEVKEKLIDYRRAVTQVDRLFALKEMDS